MTTRIQLATDEMFDLLNPDPSVISLAVIAHALSRLCRFTGHVSASHYSVAEHCVHVSWLVPARDAREGLMHDAAEAFIGDVAAPLKKLLPDYRRIEERVERVVAERFGLLYPWPLSVREADLDMLKAEALAFMKPLWAKEDWAPVLARPHTWFGPKLGEMRDPGAAFLKRARELGIDG